MRRETAMDPMTDRLDGRALSKTDWVTEVGLFASLLGIHPVSRGILSLGR